MCPTVGQRCPTRSLRLRALRPHLVPLVLLVGLAALVVGPALTQLGAAVPGHPQGDVFEHVHGYWWVSEALAAGRLPWEAGSFAVPDGGVLWFPDTLGALLAFPITRFAGAPAAFALGQWAQVAAALVAAYALGLRFGTSRAAGMLAATLFGASPLVLGLLHSGVSEYLHLAAFPLLWLASERALRDGGRALVPASLAWAWLGWANVYYALFGVFVPLVAWWVADPRPPAMVAVRRYCAVAVGAAVGVAPVVWAIAASLNADDAMLRNESAPGWGWVYLPANDLAGLLLPGDAVYPDLAARGNDGIRHVYYLGWVALGLGVAAGRRWWPALALVGTLALGPTLHWRGRPVQVAGQVVPLPAALLYVPGSPFRVVHHPYRVVVLANLVLAGAAAAALRRRPRWAGVAAGAVLVETAGAAPGPWPVEVASFGEVPPLPEPGGVWELPPDFRALNRKWLGRQVLHARAVPYTINVFLPPSWRSNAAYQAVMGCLEHAERRTIARDAHPPLRAWLVQDSPQTVPEGIAELRAWGLRYVLVGPELDADEAQCVVSRFGPAATELVVPGDRRVLDLGPTVR